MFNEIEEINWIRTYKVDDYISWEKEIIIFDIPEGIPLSMFNELVEYILENNEIPHFDGNRNIIEKIYSDYILIEYNDKKIRDKDKKLMQEKINIINPIKTDIIDWDKQIAEPVWYFDLNWKHYLIISPYNPFTEETNPELWIYKWVIVNPESYFWKVWREIRKIENKVDDIIK